MDKVDKKINNFMNRLKEFNIIALDEQQDMPIPSPGPDDSLFQ